MGEKFIANLRYNMSKEQGKQSGNKWACPSGNYQVYLSNQKLFSAVEPEPKERRR